MRYTALMELLITHQKAILFVGPTGTGKSAYVIDFLLGKMAKVHKEYKPMIGKFVCSAKWPKYTRNTNILHRVGKKICFLSDFTMF